MAPIRRYLRITKYSVIECRIYLDNPGLAQTWLLNPRSPVLPRVIESVRPLVLPKLREERERSRNKRSAKKKGIKDVVVEGKLREALLSSSTATFCAPLCTLHSRRLGMRKRVNSGNWLGFRRPLGAWSGQPPAPKAWGPQQSPIARACMHVSKR